MADNDGESEVLFFDQGSSKPDVDVNFTSSDAPPTSRPGTSSGKKARPGTGSARPGTSSGRKKVPTKSEFRRDYDSGELPVFIQERGIGRKLIWKVDLNSINFDRFLPVFFSGLQEKQDPYKFMVFEAIFDLLEASNTGNHALNSLPLIMNHIKNALNTRDPDVVCGVLTVLQQLVVCPGVGKALQQYYKQILPLCNLLKDKHLGSSRSNISDLVQETIEMIEVYGEEEAYDNIKRLIPTYESCIILTPAVVAT